MNLIGCEFLIDCELLRDRFNQPDIRRYISIHFIHSFISVCPDSGVSATALVFFLFQLSELSFHHIEGLAMLTFYLHLNRALYSHVTFENHETDNMTTDFLNSLLNNLPIESEQGMKAAQWFVFLIMVLNSLHFEYKMIQDFRGAGWPRIRS